MSEGTLGFPRATSAFRAFVRTVGSDICQIRYQRRDTGRPLVCQVYVDCAWWWGSWFLGQ